MIIISAIKSANHEAIPFIARLNQVLILYGRQHPVHRYSQSYTIDWLFSFTSVQNFMHFDIHCLCRSRFTALSNYIGGVRYYVYNFSAKFFFRILLNTNKHLTATLVGRLIL